jgi:RNA polymerase sigma-70 factor (ECF subfamily)
MDPLERFAAGDLDAFEVLFRAYQGEVYGWIVRIVRNPAAAEDLTIETFWRIYRHRKRFDPSRPFGPWARRIASRTAIDYFKSRHEPVVEALDALPHPSRPDDVMQRELREQIQKAFESLPPRLRAAATLALIEERPYGEIADALDTSLSAVKMSVSRAIQLLRNKLRTVGVHDE